MPGKTLGMLLAVTCLLVVLCLIVAILIEYGLNLPLRMLTPVLEA